MAEKYFLAVLRFLSVAINIMDQMQFVIFLYITTHKHQRANQLPNTARGQPVLKKKNHSK